jgi:hypothetical protein
MRSEKHLQNRAGGTLFLENTFNTSILQCDGKINEEYLDRNSKKGVQLFGL